MSVSRVHSAGGPAAGRPGPGGRDLQGCGAVPQGWGAGPHAEGSREKLHGSGAELGQVSLSGIR